MDEAESAVYRLVVMTRPRLCRGFAAGSSSTATDQGSAGVAVSPDRDETDDSAHISNRLDGLADRVEQLPDRVLVYTADGEAAAAAAYERGLRPASVLVLARVAGGRVPEPDRPQPGRIVAVVSRASVRILEHDLSSPARLVQLSPGGLSQPFLYLVAMGIGLGLYVNRSATCPAACHISTTSPQRCS